MGPTLGKNGPASRKFLEERRDLLLWFISLHSSSSSAPGYLVNENGAYILLGGDRLIVKPARG